MPAVQFKDYYKILGVERSADDKAIRSAFRKLARKHHPDINPGDKAAEDRFKEINEAFEVLSDAAKRKMYDRYGEEWQRYRDAGFTGDEPAGSASGPVDFGQWFTGQSGQRPGGFRVEYGDDEGGFSDFFHTLFGSRTGRRGATFTQRVLRRRGENLEVNVDLSFEEAFRGTSRRLDVQTHETCPTCRGAGIVRESMCPTCDGTGQVPKTKAVEVKIPAGVTTGSRIRVKGQGGAGIDGGPPGDVYLRTSVRPNTAFEREGDNLRTDVEVPLYDALLGGEAMVTTPSGRVALTIPAETQPGRVFRLRGQGMPKLKGAAGERGDLLARVKVVLPTDLSERERALIGQLRDVRETN
ncbi:MAG: DnaJ C-terminal domain-containing protein [Thermomicrobiales bacterium]